KEIDKLSDELFEKSIDYSTAHEERLIEGLCLPINASIYLHMLDAIKGIAWHGKKIAEQFSPEEV
ncbi:MAG: hypothetical protein D6828_06715, partial [Nitrospirae bacterium]